MTCINNAALRGKIIEKYKTIQNFASVFGCSYTQMLNLLSGKCGWSVEKARKATVLLGIEDDAQEIVRIFFSNKN